MDCQSKKMVLFGASQAAGITSSMLYWNKYSTAKTKHRNWKTLGMYFVGGIIASPAIWIANGTIPDNCNSQNLLNKAP